MICFVKQYCENSEAQMMPKIWILRDFLSLMLRKSSDAIKTNNTANHSIDIKILSFGIKTVGQSKKSLWQNDCQIVTWSKLVTLIGHMAQSY